MKSLLVCERGFDLPSWRSGEVMIGECCPKLDPQCVFDEPVAGMTDRETTETAILDLGKDRTIAVVENDLTFVLGLEVRATDLHAGLGPSPRVDQPMG